MISEYLERLGLTKSEATVYKSLLEKSPTTILELSKYVSMKRLTVHFIVESLIKKGIVSQTKIGNRRKVVAESPDNLRTMIDSKRNELDRIEGDFPIIMEKLHKLIPGTEARKTTKVKYFEGEKGFKEVCQRSIDNSNKEVFFLSNFNEWRKVYSKDYGIKHYVPERIRKEIFLKTLSVKNRAAKDLKNEDASSFRKTKYLPKEFDFKPTVIICEQEVSIMLSNKPYTSIVIEDNEVAYMFKQIFNYLWENKNSKA